MLAIFFGSEVEAGHLYRIFDIVLRAGNGCWWSVFPRAFALLRSAFMLDGIVDAREPNLL